jgi:hypothetical protein
MAYIPMKSHMRGLLGVSDVRQEVHLTLPRKLIQHVKAFAAIRSREEGRVVTMNEVFATAVAAVTDGNVFLYGFYAPYQEALKIENMLKRIEYRGYRPPTKRKQKKVKKGLIQEAKEILKETKKYKRTK